VKTWRPTRPLAADGPISPPVTGIRLGRWPAAAAPCVIAIAGLAVFLGSLHGIHLSRMTGLGLISVLPVAALAGAGLLVLAFVLMLGLHQARPVVLGAMLVAIVGCLDGAAAIVEPEPRFATAYQIAGFVDYVSRTGHTAPGVDAYFSWPGFFALTAFVEGVVGKHDLIPVLRWWPMIIDVLCLVPLALIMRGLRVNWRAQWFAMFLFSAGNWVGQDYFSPQSLNYLLYLVFIAILLTWFGDPPGQAGYGERVMLLVLLIAIFLASTASHQLTPFVMLAACGGLVLARRCTLTGLPVLLGVILAGWISFRTVDYWSGHLSGIFGGVGHLGANFSASVGARLSGSTPEHQRALYIRVGLAGMIMALAGLGMLRRRLAGVRDRALLVLVCIPFLLVGLQSYGGEVALRVYLFALPAASVLAACLFFPGVRPERRPWRALAGAAIVGAVFVGLFFGARYGNEAFEQTPAGELTAMNYIYAHDRAGVRLAWLSNAPKVDVTPQMPWAYRDIDKVRYLPVQAPRDPAAVAGLVAGLRKLGQGTYLIFARTQGADLEQVASYPRGWGSRFRASMAAAAGVRVAFADRDAAIYAVGWTPGTPRPSLLLHPRGTSARSTTWTPVGLAALGLLLPLLITRELARMRRPARRRLARLLTMASGPLLVLLLAVVAERFAVLS
jgi:hypothetical protein